MTGNGSQMESETRKQFRQSRGFTLIELLVVIVIMGILAALVVPNLLTKPDEAKVAAAKSQLRTFETALSIYYMDHGDYPGTDSGLDALVDAKLLPKIPMDPWGNDYVYLQETDSFDLWTNGKDGAPGGDGFKKDINSKNLGN